ncbi:MAG TPA: RHS repeat-associated core domain-containing protein [Candidatus Acidoferrum sp.]
MLRSSATSYFHADGLGSITSLSNSAGTIANTYTYDSYGNLTASTGTLVNSFRYTARESDPETRLYYYRARYYDPNAGRFLTEDPIGSGAGNNVFTYVRNEPTRFADPSGLVEFDPSCNCSNGFKGPNMPLADQLASAGAARITDTSLRDCILSKLNNGTVKCGGERCDKGSKPDKKGRVVWGWALPWGNTINLCKPSAGDDFSLACTIIHEFAHTCGHPFEGVPQRAEKQAFPGVCYPINAGNKGSPK